MITWTLGDVTITAIVESDLTGVLGFLLPAATPAAVKEIAWLSPHFADTDGQLRGQIQAFAVQTPTHRIVVDTCIGNDKDRTGLFPQWSQMQTSFLDRLAAIGFSPEAVDTVLCTHLHVDHVGWNTRLVDGEWKPTFPNAQYLFGRVEFDHATKETGLTPEQLSQGNISDLLPMQRVYVDSIQPIIAAGLAKFVETDHQICEEVALRPSLGHTPGHVSVTITSKGKHALISGDFVHHPCQMAHPEWGTLVDTDPQQAEATRRGLFAELADSECLLIGTHFAAPTAGHVVKDGPAFRLETEAS